jgi:aryl-alcohol dehydrogenase-like predicted oxidoreductase
MATREGTWGYRDRFGDAYGRTYFRRFGPGVVASIGVGTYLGEPTDAVDERYREALVTAFEHGGNLVDTAVNYRCGRSERVVGRALRDADVDREALVVATKGGFVPFDGERPDDPGAYVRETFVEPGLAPRDRLVRGQHCIAPGFLDAMLDRSLDNLGVETVDCYYLHNPETQLAAADRATVYDRIEAAFELLEARRAADDVRAYGVATWDALRVAPDDEEYLSLAEIRDRARAAASARGLAPEDNGFAAVQLPFNVLMADAFTRAAHGEGGARTSALEYAHEAGIDVVTSATLAQGRLLSEFPSAIEAKLSGDSRAQRAINFARSAPGVTAALVGTRRRDHVAENLAAGTFDPLGARAFDAVFE